MSSQDRRQLACMNRGFERIARVFFIVYYGIATLQIVVGTLAVVAHAHEDDGLIGSADTVALERMVLTVVAETLSGFLILVPIHSTAVECSKAFAIGKEYELSNEEIPARVLKHLLNTRTLCFSHPLVLSECEALRTLATSVP